MEKQLQLLGLVILILGLSSTLFAQVYDDFEDGGAKWLTDGIYEPWSINYDPIFGSNIAQDSAGLYHEKSYVCFSQP